MKNALHKIVNPLRDHPALFRFVRDTFHPPQRMYQHLHFRGPIEVCVADGASFWMHHFGAQIENDLFWAGYGKGFEGAELRLWQALVQHAEYIADVGANTGLYALAAAALNPEARILAVEPVPRIAEKLLANIKLNAFDISLLQAAVTDFDGSAELFDTTSEHSYSSSLDPSLLKGYEMIKVPVRAVRLDTAFDELGWPRVDLLKIDVEKCEAAALAGMQASLARDRPTILVEILDDSLELRLGDTLRGLGYRFLSIGPSAKLTPVQKLTATSDRNLLVVPKDRWTQIDGSMEKI
jgi:FkbM family methyltransferase